MITVIDPNNKKIFINRNPELNAGNDISNIDNYNNGLYQSVNPAPEYEKMFIFTSLKIRRRPNSVILGNASGQDIDEDLKRQLLINDQVINNQKTFVAKQDEIVLDLIGYEQDGSLYKDRPFTNAYTDSLSGNETDINVSEFSGFGVSKIVIESEMTFINKAKVTIIDARRGANLKDSPLALLMNTTPPPEYELKLKGYYGRMVRYLMQPINIPKVSFDSNTGAFVVEIELASINWKPLTQVYMSDLFVLPFMKTNKKNNLDTRINLRSKESPKSFYEFYLRAKKFYDDITVLKQSNDIGEQEKDIRLRESVVNKLLNLSSNFGVQFEGFYKKNSLINLEKRFSRQDKFYIINYSQNPTGLNNQDPKELIRNFYNKRVSDFNNDQIINEIGLLNYFDTLNIVDKPIANGRNQLTATFDEFYSLLIEYNKDLNEQFKKLNENKRELINNKIRDRFGTNNGNDFKPTVRSIVKLIADDVDIFFNILKETTVLAEGYHEKNTTEDLLEEGSNLGGIDGIHPFPFYSQIDVDSNNTQRLVKSIPPNPDWFETKLTEDYYKASIQSVINTEDFKENKTSYDQEFIIQDEITEEQETNKDNTNSKFEIPKLNIYYNLKLIVDSWILGYSSTNPDYAYPNNGGRALIDNMVFVDRAFNDIGDSCIIDFLKILNQDIRTDSVYGLMVSLLEDNNFKIFPLQNFMILNKDTWVDAFEPIEEVEELDYQPLLVCMYIGDNSIQVDSNNTHKSDSFSLDNPPPDFLTESDSDDTTETSDATKNFSKVFAFKVGFGEQNQSYFKNINFNVDGDNPITLEYLKIIDQISNDAGKANPILLGQSMYDVYSKMSYNASIEMLGNMMIQPTQYFTVENIPIFNGTYMITHVSHNIEGNTMNTTFKGHKVGRYIRPIVTEFAETVDIFYDSININFNSGLNVSESNENQYEVLENLVRNQNSSYDVNTIVTNSNNLVNIDLGYKLVSVDTTISSNNLGNTTLSNDYIFS